MLAVLGAGLLVAVQLGCLALVRIDAARDLAATHNCWAYKVGQQYRSSDDGEPSGTAGRPILAAIEGEDLEGVCVLVVRYYGGIKLGAGGLVRAYGGAARDCLRAAPKRHVVPKVTLALQAPFELIGPIYPLLEQYAAEKLREDYGDDGTVRMEVQVEQDMAQRLQASVQNATSGRVQPNIVSVRATQAPAKEAVGQAEDYATQLTSDIVRDEKQYILQTYARPPIVFAHGEGARMYDVHGKEYLDFAAGIAVNALGHGNEAWLSAVTEQAGQLAHVSNLFHTIPQVRLAQRLVESSFADKVFYANSGTEANEAAIKFARKYAKVQAGLDPYNKDTALDAATEIVSFTSSFHGRTMGSLALTYKDQYRTPFQPVMPGNVMVPYQDLDAAAAVIKKGKTCAVFVEPIQGEGGINPGEIQQQKGARVSSQARKEFLAGLRALCDEAGALLVFDEVQCGLGRTGKLWGYQHAGVEPDMMSLAKPLAGGLPIGAVLLKQKVADVMTPGDHGSTFAGNPLVCHAACTVFDIIADPAFLAGVTAKGERLREGLRRELAGNPHVKEVRGLGLICGIELDQMAGKLVEAARDRGVIVITAGKGDIVRLVPPLVVTEEDIDKCCALLGELAREVLA
ncbi:hypothetical protein N2152v2_004595 [Parachlorella kessleri]